MADPPTADRRWWSGFPGSLQLGLREPAAWPIALAAFLVRGGILLFVLPVVVLPTPTGLATALGPDIIAAAMGSITPAVVRLTVLAIVFLGTWLIVGSLVGAAADLELVRWAATSDASHAVPGPEVTGDPSPTGRTMEARSSVPTRRSRPVARVALVRLACHLPLAIVAIWAAVRIVAAVYAQYVAPGDLAVPLPLRVIDSVPDAIALLLVAWLLGEALGGQAARGVILDDRPAGAAIRGAVASLVLHPRSAGLVLIATTAVLGVLIALPMIAAAVAWGRLAVELRGGGDPLATALSTLAFAALWLGALLGAAIGATMRGTAWTWHALRVRRSAPLGLASSVAAAGSSTAGA